MSHTPHNHTDTPPKGERLAKRIAAAGICSRREAEKLITAGKVTVNGNRITSPATNVQAEDTIEVNNKPIFTPAKTRLWLYHKPTGTLTTHKDPEGRPTVFAQLPANLPRVVSIGRLDMNSEGLLLLTNNGELARRLDHPSTGLTRRYRVRTARRSVGGAVPVDGGCIARRDRPGRSRDRSSCLVSF